GRVLELGPACARADRQGIAGTRDVPHLADAACIYERADAAVCLVIQRPTLVAPANRMASGCASHRRASSSIVTGALDTGPRAGGATGGGLKARGLGFRLRRRMARMRRSCIACAALTMLRPSALRARDGSMQRGT